MKDRLLSALLQELKFHHTFFKNRPLVSVYFGGGTPSLFGPERVEKLLQYCHTHFDLQSPEVTLELNPEQYDRETLRAYFISGVNRLSIGVQSFSDKELSFLGRTHTSDDVYKTIQHATEVGFHNISIDLMYELPNQTKLEWSRTLEIASTLPITHISLYNLQLEEGSLYFKQKEKIEKLMPDDETGLWMYERAQEILAQVEFTQYEISAFARQGMISVHNSGYWTGREFLGIGPSAWSFINNERTQRIPNLQRYIQALETEHSPIESRDICDPHERRKELLAVGLRLFCGIKITDFETTWGPLDEASRSELARLKQEGFVIGDTLLQLTEKGRRFYDHVATCLI